MTTNTSSGRLAGRTALITGASRGIGRAIALAYAAEGANLFLTATNITKLEETQALAMPHGGDIRLHAADIADPAAVLDQIASATEGATGQKIGRRADPPTSFRLSRHEASDPDYEPLVRGLERFGLPPRFSPEKVTTP